RGDAFRQRPPASPAQVAKFIGQLFGAGEDPCLRARRQTSGLLTATSDRERELLAEELRRQRQYCGP
ncbi:MAG TPA: hypothetical protein VK325_10130, partial [Pseudoxanthomonas sp.]|nr:hypothetical protein [Pseudoxanthomonas sp.]